MMNQSITQSHSNTLTRLRLWSSIYSLTHVGPTNGGGMLSHILQSLVSVQKNLSMNYLINNWTQ